MAAIYHAARCARPLLASGGAGLRCSARRLCSEPPKPPKAFESFFPKAGSAKRPASSGGGGSSSSSSSSSAESGAEKRAASGGEASESSSSKAAASESGSSSSGGGGSFFGGGGAGGGGGGNPLGGMDGAVPRLMLVGALGLGLTALTASGPSSARTMQEISMQHFMSNVLAQGRVSKLVVVNGTTVRVFVDHSSAHENFVDGADGAPPTSAARERSEGGLIASLIACIARDPKVG